MQFRSETMMIKKKGFVLVLWYRLWLVSITLNESIRSGSFATFTSQSLYKIHNVWIPLQHLLPRAFCLKFPSTYVFRILYAMAWLCFLRLGLILYEFGHHCFTSKLRNSCCHFCFPAFCFWNSSFTSFQRIYDQSQEMDGFKRGINPIIDWFGDFMRKSHNDLDMSCEAFSMLM